MLTPRTVRTATVVALLLLTLPLLLRPATPAQETPVTESVDAVVIPVSDLGRAVTFYSTVLSFEPVDEPRGRSARMRLGREFIELVESSAPGRRPMPTDSRSNDRWFQHVAIIVNDMEQAYLWLRRHHVEHVSAEPQRLPDWNPNASGIWAFYFKDPDGHVLEILQFPPDKGDARWQVSGDRVFLGIDHTAIVVGDTERSLRLYRDVLGFKVVGRSENYGPEQERLNNVSAARLRITTLHAANGPGVELLEYLSPRDGRPLPAGSGLNDLIAWRTVMTVASPRVVTPLVASAGAAMLAGSAGQAPLIIRDADGHVLELRGR